MPKMGWYLCSSLLINLLQGNILRSELDGAIIIKSYLKGSPEVRLALNDDLILSGLTTSSYSYGAPSIDDFNFHECASILMIRERSEKAQKRLDRLIIRICLTFFHIHNYLKLKKLLFSHLLRASFL